MEIDLIIDQVSKKLDFYSKELRSNLKEIVEYFNDRENLTLTERNATQISFWRSIDDKSCSATIEKLIGDDYDDEIDSKYQSFSIFDKWNECITWAEIFEYTEEQEDQAFELETKLELCYIQWFVKNWYLVNGHLSNHIEYFIMENNSVRNFDLQRFNFTDLYPQQKGPNKSKPYYNRQLTSFEIGQRVLMDMIDDTYSMPLIRRLTDNVKTIEFWYSNCELIIRDISRSQLPKIILAKRLKDSDNKFKIKSKYLELIVTQVDSLIENGFIEIE